MRIEIRGNKDVPERMRELARHRLQFTLGRFADGVSEVVVRLTDQNGPRGGKDDKRCAIAVRTRDTEILIDEAAGTYEAALIRGARRAGAALRRHLGWQKDWRHGRMRTPLR